MGQSLLHSDQTLVCVKYFTSRVSSNPDKVARQNTYIEALETLDNVRIFYGKYQSCPRRCTACGATDWVPGEKMTDVNIAVEMLKDAFQDSFDVAMLTSADSDLVAPVSAIKSLFPDKRIVLAFPPKRYSKDLAKVAGSSFTIGRANLNASQFPDVVTRKDGFKLVRPATWT